MQPARRLQLPPLPELLLRLEHLKGRLPLQDGAGRREFQINRPAGLGKHLVDRVDGRAGGELRTQRAQEFRNLRRLRCDLRYRDHRSWRRRRGFC